MTTDIKSMMCGHCDTGLKTIAEPKPDSRVECPICGNGDTLENVIKIIGEGVTEQTAIAFNKSLKKSFASSNGVKFVGKTIHPKKRAFYTNIEFGL